MVINPASNSACSRRDPIHGRARSTEPVHSNAADRALRFVRPRGVPGSRMGDERDYRDRVSTRDVPAQIGNLPPIGRPANGALLQAGITTLAQVATYSRRELLALHGVGPKAVGILAAALAEHGLAFAD